MLVKFIKNGCQLSGWHPFFLFLIFSVPVFAAAAPSESDAYHKLSSENAVSSESQNTAEFSQLEFATPELSILLMDQFQPALEENPLVWFEWEKKRLQQLSNIGRWSSIVDRINSYQSTLPEEYQPWFILIKASSQLKSSQTEKVLEQIRHLLWSEYDLTTEQIAQARRLLIRSYLAENKAHDAQRAMLRYRQDYGEAGLQWKRLQAQVLLATQRFEQAADLLSTETDVSLDAIKALTRLQAGLDATTSVFEKTLSILNDNETELSQSLQRQYWTLIYIAAEKLNNKQAAINALEKVLLTGASNADEDLMVITPKLLWEKYQLYASDIGNQNHLLMGDDQAWFQLASNRIEKQPLQARALLGYLALRASEKAQQQVSMQQLALLIKDKMPQGMKLVEQLFFSASVFSSLDQVPDQVRYLLLDFALSRGKIKQAATLFGYLPEPPEGQQRLAWSLRRARVMVLGGQYPEGAEVLQNIIQTESIDLENTNRLMQVVFDFQKVDQHSHALKLFTTLLQKKQQPGLQREIRFWMAESYQALKDYKNAAHYYLTSALMISEKKNDPWSQTARYRAADVLSQAGLINDARGLYQQLLKTTDSANRKAVIKQKLQQLWLLEGMPDDVSK